MARTARRWGGTRWRTTRRRPAGRLDDHPQAGQVAVLQGGEVQVDLVHVRGEFRQFPGQPADRGLVDFTGQRVARAWAPARAGDRAGSRDPGYPQHPVVVDRGFIAKLRGLRGAGRDHPARGAAGPGPERMSARGDGTATAGVAGCGAAAMRAAGPGSTTAWSSSVRNTRCLLPAVTDDLADCCQRGPRTEVRRRDDQRRGYGQPQVLGGVVTTVTSMPESGPTGKSR